MGRALPWVLVITFPLACKGEGNDGPPAPPPSTDSGVSPGATDAGLDPCLGVSCPISGTTCDPVDGLCHCGLGPVCVGAEVCSSSAGLCRLALEDRCTAGSRFSPGTPAFSEVTQDWDLTGVEGTRLAVLDFNSDGFPDLFVRRGGNGADDFRTGGVRRSWLLMNDGGRGFVDVTVSSGIRQTRTATTAGRPGEVVAFADVDNDGDLDVYTGMSTGIDGAMPGETSELMLNDGTGHFTFGPDDSGLRQVGSADIVAGASFVDFDRDGFVDLFVGQHNYSPAGSTSLIFKRDFLYRGDGTGRFVEVGAATGIVTADWSDPVAMNEGRAHSRAWSTAACDLNGDGTTELLVASYGRAPNHLWQGLRSGTDVTFTNRSVISGYAYDGNQSWTDNEFAKCYCQSRPSAEGCSQAGAPRIQCGSPNWQHATDREPYRLGGNSGTTVCADVDNDGDLDLLTTEITHWWAGTGADESELLLNSGEGDVRFDRPGKVATNLLRTRTGIAWDQGDMTAAVFDFDDDGWPDVYLGASDYSGNRGLLFQQDSPGHFLPVAPADGILHHRSHGIAVADFDQDGDLDVILGHSRSRCEPAGLYDCYPTAQIRMFENVVADTGNSISIELEGGAGTNKSAIGARVKVTAGGVTQTQEVGGGHGHYGIQHEHRLHFGLGTACTADVEVRWPNTELGTSTFAGAAGYRYRLTEGAEAVPEP